MGPMDAGSLFVCLYGDMRVQACILLRQNRTGLALCQECVCVRVLCTIFRYARCFSSSGPCLSSMSLPLAAKGWPNRPHLLIPSLTYVSSKIGCDQFAGCEEVVQRLCRVVAAKPCRQLDPCSHFRISHPEGALAAIVRCGHARHPLASIGASADTSTAFFAIVAGIASQAAAKGWHIVLATSGRWRWDPELVAD